MARMYSRKKGKAGSKRPMIPAQWVEYTKPDIEKLILKHHKDGLSTASIGKLLRDQYGIPSIKAVTGKKITAILAEQKVVQKIPEDLLNLLKKAVNLRGHMAKNKKDSTSKRGLELLESKIRRISKYYVKEGKLPSDWRYDPERAKLIIETEK